MYPCFFFLFYIQIFYFQKEMFSLGKLIEVVHQSHETDIKYDLKEDDLIIVTSVQGRFLNFSNISVLDMPCRKVLITEMNDLSVLNRFDHYLRSGIHADETLRKYSIMRIYEKILLHYYQLFHHSS